VLEAPLPDEGGVIYPRDPDEPIACMFELDCLMEQIEKASRAPGLSPVPEVAPGPSAEVVPAAT
jgi:hypothetical protein